jgi:hypothetical protein
MKQLVSLVCAVSLTVSSFAQNQLLSITTNKTTSLVFPFAIKHVDRGSQDIVAEEVKEAENILLIKAANKNFPETNLTVVTEDGSVYDFNVDYSSDPSLFVYQLPVKIAASITAYANSILDNPKTINGPGTGQGSVAARIAGIYVKDNVMYFQLKFYNLSHINYDIDFIRIYIRDKKKSKRTAIQDNDLKPLYISGNTKLIKAMQRSAIVFALNKFTIPDGKYLSVEINEKNGGRNLSFKVKNKIVMDAIPLPDLK